MFEERKRRRAWAKELAALEKRGANPYLEWGTSAPPPPGSIGGQVGGLHVTTESAIQVEAVYACCGLLADSVASLPLRALDAPATQTSSKELASTPELLVSPYEEISLTDWIVVFVWSLALRGNFFGQVVDRDRMGHPTQIMPVNPDIVRPEVHSDGTVTWYYAGKAQRPEDVFHVRYQSMPGHLMGLNPIQVMRYSFGLAHTMDVFAEQYFANSARPDMVFEVPGEMDEDATRAMLRNWIASKQGVKQSHNPGVVTGGTKVNVISVNPADQQLLEQRKYQAEQIAGMVFRIPPHMLGMNERSTSFGRGIEQQERGFVANTLSGYLVRIERALTACLPDGQYASFDISHRIRGSEEERAKTASLLRLAGTITANEARGRFFDLPPVPDGDELMMPINTELLKTALEELKKLEAQPDEPIKPPESSHRPSVVAPVTNGSPVPNGKPKTPAGRG